MADWRLRFRSFLDTHLYTVITVLVVVALLGGWVTYTAYATPVTTTENRTVSSWQMTGEYAHSATVTENNSLYPVGTTLSNRSVYFVEITPWFNGTYTFTYSASQSGDLHGNVTLQFLLSSVEEEQQRRTVVWQTSRTLNERTVESLDPDETVRVPFSINLSRTINRTERISDELGNSPGQPQVLVHAHVDVTGTANDSPLQRTENYTLPVALGDSVYRPGNTDNMSARHETTRTVTVERPHGLLQRMGGPLLLVVSLVGLGGLGSARHSGKLRLSPAERERLRYEDDRDDFDEWISTIRLPEDVFDRPEAEAESLSSLVDFAIDTNNSVLEDPGTQAYYVVHDGYLYTYRPPVLFDGHLQDGEKAGEDTDEPDFDDGESDSNSEEAVTDGS